MIDLPLRTWVKRPIPGSRTPLGASKHTRWGYCESDGMFYINGGDYDGPVNPLYGLQSGRNEMWQMNVAASSIKLIQPFCRTDGGVQPSGPDECGWCWDSKRKVFWHVPGYQWGARGCNPASEIRGTIMAFDPAKTEKPWTNVGPRFNAIDLTWSVYDPVRDSILSLCKLSNGAALITTKVSLDPPGTSHSLNYLKVAGLTTQLDAGDAVTGFDPESRLIYGVTANNPNLWAVNVDTKEYFPTYAPLPQLTGQVENMTVWDPVNKVLYWLNRIGGDVIDLRIFYPATKQWERIPNTSVIPRGRTCGFDIQNNCLITGGHLGGTDYNAIWLYRHAASAEPLPDTTAPGRPGRPRLIEIAGGS